MNAYFAAANTGNGFYSLFADCFSPDRLDRIYILKGGPGTGKSTLIRKILQMAEICAYEAEAVYCSSDTDSLDGVILPTLGVAVVDGTSPHAVEPRYPGAVEKIVNLGDAFDFDGLQKEKAAISALIKEKKKYYGQAYRCLEGAAKMDREREITAENAFLAKKADAAAERLCDTFKKTKKGNIRRLFFSAIGTKGTVTLPTLQNRSKTSYAVIGKYGTDSLLLQYIFNVFAKRGFAMTVGINPLRPDTVESIFLEKENLLFYIGNGEAPDADKKINSARFTDVAKLAKIRQQVRFFGKCRQILLDGAALALQNAGNCHAKLEELYGNYTDFQVINGIQEQTLSEIFTKK